MTPPPRKRVRSYNEPGHAHELTFSCFRRQPLLSRDRTCRWFVDAMESARRRLDFAIWAYVIMPEHVHIIVHPRTTSYAVAKVRSALKIPVQRRAIRFLETTSPAFLERLRDVQPNGAVHHRFWQRGGGYDRNVIELSTLERMIEYIQGNPVRRGLVARPVDWVWSSARYHEGCLDVPIRMDPLPRLDGSETPLGDSDMLSR